MVSPARSDLISRLEAFLDGKSTKRELWEHVLELLYQPPAPDDEVLHFGVRLLEGSLLQYFDHFIDEDELRKEVAVTLQVLRTVTFGPRRPPITSGGVAIVTGSTATTAAFSVGETTFTIVASGGGSSPRPDDRQTDASS